MPNNVTSNSHLGDPHAVPMKGFEELWDAGLEVLELLVLSLDGQLDALVGLGKPHPYIPSENHLHRGPLCPPRLLRQKRQALSRARQKLGHTLGGTLAWLETVELVPLERLLGRRRHSPDALSVHVRRRPWPHGRWPAAIGLAGPLLLPSEGLSERERFTRRPCAHPAWRRQRARPDLQAVRSTAATLSTERAAPPSRSIRSRVSR